MEVLARDGDGKPARIRLQADVPQGQHVRVRGEDVRSGDRFLAAGTRLDAPQLMLLAALGVPLVGVRATPRVALLNTGRELVDDPAQPLASGEIRNSNGPYLARRIEQAGAELVLRQTVSDDQRDLMPMSGKAAALLKKDTGIEARMNRSEMRDMHRM